MSEEVIGTVLLRKQPQRHFSSVTTAAKQRKNRMSSILTGPNVSNAQRLLTMDELSAITDQETLAELGLLLKDRRQRRKIIQQRHQKKKARMAEELIDYVPKLREEVEKLKFRHNSLKTRMTKNSIWSVASEYFRVFQHGFPRLETSQAEAIVFLRATMASDVNIGIVSGIDALVERWKVFARTFPDGAVQLERLNRISDASLIATTSTRVLLTRQAIESIFPSLRENSTRRDVILTKLLGRRVVLRGSVRFHWDSATKRVAELVTCMEMMSPMLQLLGNLEDVAFAFHGASDLMM
ncbi:hypothetical protein P3T76_006587 [Phytophthora citrophthora]|uniref:Bzip transcription factor n=1 Tax=Phytophthora citrophthora TaxID=4793 RepID=A0AAD9GP92_9STRA|nr:hypothetical protein P3T76_006584 [Phytophthora citrophthora]KAK1942265.1 hypothetical protein P3T76_006587 [Phytophthora citrophthora]